MTPSIIHTGETFQRVRVDAPDRRRQLDRQLLVEEGQAVLVNVYQATDRNRTVAVKNLGATTEYGDVTVQVGTNVVQVSPGKGCALPLPEGTANVTIENVGSSDTTVKVVVF